MLNIQAVYRDWSPSKETKKHLQQKFNNLVKFLPKGHDEDNLTVELYLDPSGKQDNNYKCHATMRVPGSQLYAEATSSEPESAIDQTASKLKASMLKYKSKHSTKRGLGIKNILKRK